MSAAQVEDKGQKECTPLMEAASAGHVDIIRLLISHNADVNAQCATGNTPLMFACAGGHVEAVKELLKHGANVEDQNENGHTPLMEAASAGHVEVAKVCIHQLFITFVGNRIVLQMIRIRDRKPRVQGAEYGLFYSHFEIRFMTKFDLI